MRDLDGGRGDSLEVILASDQIGRAFEIVTDAAFNAEEVGQEDGFPKYGTFLKARQSNGNDCWLELSQHLEKLLVEREDEMADGGSLVGAVFRVASCRKNADGTWRYQLEWYDDFETAREAA